MAPRLTPVASKKRRVEDEVRPKKKVKKSFKKQKTYHSSSEEDSDDGHPQQHRASDAPQRKPNEPKPTAHSKYIATGSNAEVNATSKFKPILKRSKPAAKPVEELSADEDEDEDTGTDDDLEDNTLKNIVNGLPNEDEESSAAEDEDDDPDLDGISDDSADEEAGDDIPSESEASITSSQARTKKKRNDPEAFATSITKILDTKLTKAKRSDPVLSRSKDAAQAHKEQADSKLEAKAKAQIRAEKRAASEKGRVRDVLGLQTPDVDTGKILEEEKRIKKVAQRGVIRMFTAVREMQVKAEQAQRQARESGVVGMKKREEMVNEMSKQGFLDLISSGGKKEATAA